MDLNMTIRVVLLCILFAACKESGKPSLTLKSSEEVLITPKVLMSTNPAHIRFVESDSGQYLFFINHISRNPQFIDFESGELVKDIIHHNDGPNSMRNRTGVGLLEGDSIWVTFSPSSIGCVNFSSEVIFKRVIDNSPIPLTNLASNFHQSLYRHQSKIFGMQPSFMSHHTMDKRDIRNHPLVYSYDVELNLVKWYDVYYPDDYWDQGKKISNFSWARRENKLYISPWYHHEIQVFDMDSESVVDRVIVKSENINRFNYVNIPPGSHEEALLASIGSDQYGILLYDKYRDCFYRFYNPGYSDENAYSIEVLWKFYRSRPVTGLMVLDRDLNVLGEYVFEKVRIHAGSNMFVGKKGLYLSLNNENSPDFNEESLRYLVVQFNMPE
jgi:hypothetical protein